MKRFLALGVLSWLAACGGSVFGDLNAGAGGATGGNGVSADGGFDELPCDIAVVLSEKCVSCHGPSLAAGAPYSLLSRTRMAESAPGYPTQTVGQRVLIRMQAGTMPPAPSSVTVSEVSAMQTWVQAGMPAGSCGTPAHVDAPTTCVSQSFWTQGNEESDDMNPGLACRSCHLATGHARKAFFFMGTVFQSAHEKDTCNAQPPARLRVEILDQSGQVVLSMLPLPNSGNFFSDTRTAVGSNGQAIALPYRARVVGADGGSLTMQTPQTTGDCNACHTEQGANGASGRIVWPQ